MHNSHNAWFPYASFGICTLFCGCEFCFLFLSTTQINILHPYENSIETSFIWFILLDQKRICSLIQLACLPRKHSAPPVGSVIKSDWRINVSTSSYLYSYNFFSNFWKQIWIFFFFDPNRVLDTHDLGPLPFPNSSLWPGFFNGLGVKNYACIASSFHEH